MQVVYEARKPTALKQRLFCYYYYLTKNDKAITQ